MKRKRLRRGKKRRKRRGKRRREMQEFLR